MGMDLSVGKTTARGAEANTGRSARRRMYLSCGKADLPLVGRCESIVLAGIAVVLF